MRNEKQKKEKKKEKRKKKKEKSTSPTPSKLMESDKIDGPRSPKSSSMSQERAITPSL